MERFYSAGENFSRNTIGLWAEKPKAFLQPKENPAKKGPGRTQLRAAGAVWFALLQFDLARLRLRRRPLRQIKLQYTVVIGGFDRDVYKRQVFYDAGYGVCTGRAANHRL